MKNVVIVWWRGKWSSKTMQEQAMQRICSCQKTGNFVGNLGVDTWLLAMLLCCMLTSWTRNCRLYSGTPWTSGIPSHSPKYNHFTESLGHFPVNLKRVKVLAGVRNPNGGSAGAIEILCKTFTSINLLVDKFTRRNVLVNRRFLLIEKFMRRFLFIKNFMQRILLNLFWSP